RGCTNYPNTKKYSGCEAGSPTRSSAKHTIALGISDRSVRRTLLLDLKFHQYKMMVAQELAIGYLKGKANKPCNSEELKAAIRREIAAISEDVLQRIMLNFNERFRKCVQAGGRHLDDIIFKT
ncbi:hypothetical protein C0J52_25759, partial [Blattella germanica]